MAARWPERRRDAKNSSVRVAVSKQIDGVSRRTKGRQGSSGHQLGWELFAGRETCRKKRGFGEKRVRKRGFREVGEREDKEERENPEKKILRQFSLSRFLF